MITIVIDGPEKERAVAARQLRRDLEISGKITTLYPDGFPEQMPTSVDVAIVVSSIDELLHPLRTIDGNKWPIL